MPAEEALFTTIKQEAMRLVNALPDSATWDDLMHQIYVHQKIEAGLKDLKSGRKHTHACVRKSFGLAAD